MKKNTCLFLFLFPAVGLAQQWKPITSGENFNYQADSATYISNAISVDSSAIVSGDSVFYLNRIVTNCPGFSGADKKRYNQPQFLQKMMIQKSGGVYCFSDPHKYWINTLAETGFSWVYDSVVLINAQVTSKTYELVLGQMDSVKTITLTGGQIIKLSKNFGIILFTSLDNGIVYSLEGIKGRNIGTLIPGFFEVYNFNVGDVFQYYSCSWAASSGGSNNYSLFKHTILSKDSTASGYTYEVKIVKKTWMLVNNFPCNFSCTIKIDTIAFVDSATHVCNLSPMVIAKNTLNPTWFSLGENASIHKVFPDTGNTISHLIGIYTSGAPNEACNYNYGLGDTLFANHLYNDFLNYIEEYTTAIGRVYHKFSFCFGGEMEELLGYVKNGDTTGLVYSDISLMGIESAEFSGKQISISPNPATTSITFSIPPLQSDAEVCFFNSLGEQVLKTKVHQAESEMRLDVAHLPAGLYFVKMNNYTGKFVKQ